MCKFLGRQVFGICFIPLVIVVLCVVSCTSSVYKGADAVSDDIDKSYITEIQRVSNSCQQGIYTKKSLQSIGYELCDIEYCIESNAATKFIDVLLNGSCFSHNERIFLLYVSKYCFSKKQKQRIREYLDLHLVKADRFYFELIAFYELNSKLTYEELENLQSLDSLFASISDSFRSGFISSIDKSHLRLYAALVNLGKVNEDLYLQKLIEIYNQTLESNPEYLDVFYYEILQHSLVNVFSKNSIIKTIEFMNEENLIFNKTDNPHLQTSNNKGLDCTLNESKNEINGLCGGATIGSLPFNYFNFCVIPKMQPDYKIMKLSADVEENLKALKSYVLNCSNSLWRVD